MADNDWVDIQEQDTWEDVEEAKPSNPSGVTFSPEMFLPQELAGTKMPSLSVGTSFKDYMSQAQPAFKLALEHPETLTGQPISPAELEKTTGSDYANIYRRAGLPGSESTSTAGQLIPEIAGGAIDIATRPSSYAGGFVLSKAAPVVGKLAQSSPAFRRFLQVRVPTLTKKLLEDFPMAPIYKEIKGIPRDITKPLPKDSPKLVQRGQKLVDAVHETMDNLGAQYQEILEPHYRKTLIPTTKTTLSESTSPILDQYGKNITTLTTQEEVTSAGGISADALRAVGVDPKNATNESLWKARWDILKQVGNPWKKEELLKKTTLKEDELMNLLTRMKATVLNNIPENSRARILRLDPQFEDAIKSGKGILRTLYDPETGRINTVRLVNIFKNSSDEGTRDLFTRFGYYDKRVNEVSRAVKGYIRTERIKKVGAVGIGITAAEQFARWRIRQAMSQMSGQGRQ